MDIPARSVAGPALRGLSVALVATFVAAFSHSAGGGGRPHPAALLLALAFALPLCIGLLRRRSSRFVLGVAVAATQALYHLLFAFFGEAPPTSLSAGSTAHSGHHSMTELSAPATDLASTGATPAMVVAHAAAAVATFAFIVAIDSALVRTLAQAIVGSGAGMVRGLLRNPVAAVWIRRIERPTGLAIEHAPLRAGDRAAASGFLRHRGPPLLHHA